MDTDTDRDAATRHAATDAATVTMVTTEDAAHLARVTVRTVRRWIQHGHLPTIETDRGKLVSPADLPEARKRASRGHDRGHIRTPNGHDRGHDNMATDTDTAMTAPALSSAAKAQMEAIRDQWLRPLVDRIEELNRVNGRLEQERDALRAELDRQLRAGEAFDVPQERDPGPVRDDQPVRVSESLIDRLRRLLGRS